MIFKQIISTCFAKGGRMETTFKELREQSVAQVWEEVAKCASQEVISFRVGGLVATLQRIIYLLFKIFGKRLLLNREIYNRLIALGIKPTTAKEITVMYQETCLTYYPVYPQKRGKDLSSNLL